VCTQNAIKQQKILIQFEIWSKILKEVAEKYGKPIMANFRRRLWQTGKKRVHGFFNMSK